MRTMTDQTMTRYAAAANALPTETVTEVMHLCDVMARHTDDAADALPYVLIALADAAATGKVIGTRTAVGVALRGAEIDRARRSAVVRLTDWSTVADEDTPTTTDDDAIPDPRWEDVRETLPADAATMLDGIAARGIERIAAAQTTARRTLPGQWTPGTDGRMVPVVTATPGSATPDGITGERRALRVGDAAAAAGLPTPRTRAASDAIRALACVSWARASLALGTAHADETVEERAMRAMRYVTTDSAALSAGYRRSRDLVAGPEGFSAPAATVRRLGWVAPVADPVSGSLTRSMPEPRKAVPSRSRKGLVTPGTSTRYTGVSEGATHGAVIAGVSTDAGVLGLARAARAAQREDAAHAAFAARMDAGAGVCTRPLPVPTTTAGCEWGCGCGGSTVALITGWAIPADSPSSAPERDHRHALTACEAPAETHDSTGTLTGHRCGCGRKRGALVRQVGVWAHRRR